MKRSFYFFAISLLLVLESNSQVQLYGLTSAGGTSGGPEGIGTIFHLNPGTGVQTLDHSFNYKISGSAPQFAELADGGNNKFYGITAGGGASGKGVIYEWDPLTNVYINKFDFGGIDGAYPLGSLTLHSGKFHGMTALGGAGNKGVIFEWDPVSNFFVKKVDFNGTNGNAEGNQTGKMIFSGGKFYGSTQFGGTNNKGVLFEWDPITNVYSKKFDFVDSSGAIPSGDLAVYSGKLYGLTRSGGVNEVGTLFEWDPSNNVYTKKLDIAIAGGAFSVGCSLTLSDNKFYGISSRGGGADAVSFSNGIL